MLNIARQIYSGWNSTQTGDTLSEAEIIPDGDAANEKKRIAKFTSDHKIVKEHDNIPLPGFTLYKTNRARWGSIDQTWLVIDPRGFLVRITSENLEKILHVTGITEGLIQEPCVWARENTAAKMTLVPISSPSYIDAVKNTELIEGKISMSEVQIGDTVLLQNKLQGVYLGTVSLYGGLTSTSLSKTELKTKSFLRRQVVQTGPDKFHFQADVKILKVLNKTTTPSTKEDSVKIMNDSIFRGLAYFSSDSTMNMSRYFNSDTVRFVSTHAVSVVNLSFDEIDEVVTTELFYSGQTHYDSGLVVLEDSKGGRFVIDHPWTYVNAPQNSIHSFNVIELSKKERPADKIVFLEEKKYYTKPKGQLVGLDKFVKFYKIAKHIKNDTYV